MPVVRLSAIFEATLPLVTASRISPLVEQFAQMLRTRTGERLDTWLEDARVSQIRELQGFVQSVERDKAAVLAGLILPQNNGLVEGHVNKLKLIKRMGDEQDFLCYACGFFMPCNVRASIMFDERRTIA